ncbi:Uncharacterised protein [Halioglobus japonicus]|nr:Uncharacterised protein [Halioglobus japonicus]
MPMSEGDSLKQTIEDRRTRIEMDRLDREERSRLSKLDRDARTADNRKDRWVQALTSLLSAAAVICVAYLAFLEALERINAPDDKYIVVSVESRSGKATVRVDKHTGDTWQLQSSDDDGAKWTKIE